MLDVCPLEVKMIVNCAEETSTYAIILTFSSPAVNLQCWNTLKEQSKCGSSPEKYFRGT
jgi:hypothetical protein